MVLAIIINPRWKCSTVVAAFLWQSRRVEIDVTTWAGYRADVNPCTIYQPSLLLRKLSTLEK
jgi:hypothetical protein